MSEMQVQQMHNNMINIVERGLTGLANIGNTCYSILVCKYCRTPMN